MVNIGSTLPPSTTTPAPKAKATQSDQSEAQDLSVFKQVDSPPRNPSVERRKRRERRKNKQDPLLESRSGKERRRNHNSSPSIDVSA